MSASFQSHLGLLTVDLSFPYAFSLKDKRRIVRSIVDRLRNKGNYSVAEVGYTDTHTRAVVTIAYVSSSRLQAERSLSQALRMIDGREGEGLVVNDWWIEWR